MRPTILLGIPMLALAFSPHQAIDTTTLQQPTCDDTQPRALSIFSLATQSRDCISALYAYAASISAAAQYHESFTAQIAEFESNYDRLCRWQRLKKPPPPMTCKHVEHFEKLKLRYEERQEVQHDLSSGFETVMSICAPPRASIDPRLGEHEMREGVWPLVDCAAERLKARRELR
ncbi:hypothetical protein KC343_g8733 [Hortaea werneckii]|nr:hypothetical protein KC352_g23509 [Hortaea werneckii]KAI7562184.1 hypothetical protein KC317_g8579 [Hortaea werneckii]KAI7610611.1 hypothetical protein KC346_g8661 [Hortaea werneckii]KAI7619415.1 hypothetical protein KC343_g8733 [Hortaea werneckii]KAI7678977.1 hypothetical protein KC319_g3012 [Hortaea werneckii]